jgi:hypothetical protein
VKQQPDAVPSFEQLADVAVAQVEHRTTFDFLRLVPHQWHADEIERFSSRVKRMADAIPLAWVPVLHPKLGVVRSYPVPFMQWIYSTMAKQFGWPMPAIAMEEGAKDQRDELRKHENARKQIEDAAEHAPTGEVSDAFAIVKMWLAAEARRLGGGEPAPLHVV